METEPTETSYGEAAMVAARFLRERKFQECISVSETYMEAIEASCISERLHPSSNIFYRKLQTIEGLAYFFLSEYERAAEKLATGSLKPDDLVLEFLSDENIAIIGTLSALASCRVTRHELLAILGDSVRSAFRDFFDCEKFSSFLELGVALEECNYPTALSLLEEVLLKSSPFLEGIPDARLRISSAVRARCVAEYVSAHQVATVGDLADAFAMGHEDALEQVIELTRCKTRLGMDYRIDLSENKIMRSNKSIGQLTTQCLSDLDDAATMANIIQIRKILDYRELV